MDIVYEETLYSNPTPVFNKPITLSNKLIKRKSIKSKSTKKKATKKPKPKPKKGEKKP